MQNPVGSFAFSNGRMYQNATPFDYVEKLAYCPTYIPYVPSGAF